MQDAIQTGIEADSDVTPASADVFAYADDGEHATVWEVDRLSDSIIRVNYYRCEAGISDHDGEETFSVDSDKTTEEFARELANADPELAIESARNWHNGDRV